MRPRAVPKSSEVMEILTTVPMTSTMLINRWGTASGPQGISISRSYLSMDQSTSVGPSILQPLLYSMVCSKEEALLCYRRRVGYFLKAYPKESCLMSHRRVCIVHAKMSAASGNLLPRCQQQTTIIPICCLLFAPYPHKSIQNSMHGNSKNKQKDP